MLKIVLLSVFLSVGLAANISDFYGTFTSVLAFQQSTPPICVKYIFTEDPSKVECTCSDGTKPTLVEIKLVEHLQPSKAFGNITIQGPVLAVDNVEDLVLKTNVTCDCAGKEYNIRGAFKTINENYILANVANGAGAEVANQDYLLARNLPTAALLAGAITTIPEVKDRSPTVLCTSEIYETLRPKN